MEVAASFEQPGPLVRRAKEVLMMGKVTDNNTAIGKSWDEVERELYTPDEIAESDLRVAQIGKVIRARLKKTAVKEVGDHGGTDCPAQ